MRYLSIFIIYIKRCLKSPSFIIAAVIIPLLIPFVGSVNTSDARGLKAGFYCQDNKELEAALFSADGMVKFIAYDNVEALSRDVENETLNCGYILSKDIFTDITDNKNGAIICLKAPSSMLTEVANEALFAVFAKLYSPDIAEDYLQRENISYDREKLRQYYNDYLSQGKAISIEYGYTDSPLINEEDNNVNTDSLGGLLALYIMLGGVLGINIWLKDENNSVPFGIMNVIAAVTILSVCSAIAIAAMKNINLLYIVRLLLYAVFTTGYCAIIKALFGRTSLICGLLPILVLGSLILCPVFIDITAILPQLVCVRYIFAPYYYLADMSVLVIGTSVIVALCFVLKTVRSLN